MEKEYSGKKAIHSLVKTSGLLATKMVKHPSIIFVTGGRGEGKTAVSHHILEKFHNERHIPVYVISPPKTHDKLIKLLPKWITIIDNVEEAPENCIILIDESAMKYHSHKWRKKETEIMDNLISISRHRKQTIIFVTHTLRKISITLLDGSILICKQPGLFHEYTERAGFKKLTKLVEKEFAKIPQEDRKKSSYVFSKQYKGFIHTSLCSYWSEELSEVFAGIPLENINKKQRNTINMENRDEIFEYADITEEPEAIKGGVKIWCKDEDKRKVLDIISKNSTIDGTLADESMRETAGKTHVDFDLSQIIKGTRRKPIPTGRFRLTSNRFDLEKSIEEMKAKKIPHMLDMETGKPVFAGEVQDFFYPASNVDLTIEVEEEVKVEEIEEEKEDKLAEFAKKMKL